MSRPTVACITLDAHGGGVAAASRLMWRAVSAHTPDARLVLLNRQNELESGTLDRLRFVRDVGLAQTGGDASWILFSHVSLARAQAPVPQRWRRPYAIFLHGVEVWGRLDATQRQVIEGASLLMANSQYTADRARRTHAWMPRIEICPLALEPGRVTAGDAVRGTATRPLVITVARMAAGERYKGHDQLIDAWRQVLARVPAAELVFIGTGDDEARLKTRVARAGLGERIRFTGFVPDAELADWYRRAALFAMPSRNEGFGLVYLEAMAHGVPCLGSSHDAAREVIEDGLTGFLVDQSDSTALSATISYCLEHVDERLDMGARGRQRVQRVFGFDAFRQRFTAILDRAFSTNEPSVAVGAGVGQVRRLRT